MKYKALFLDLDGTTVPNALDGMPSARVCEAIHQAKRHVFVCIATSRPLQYAKPVLDQLDIRGLCSVNDSTQIYDPVKKKIIRTIYLHNKDVPKILNIFRKYKLRVLTNDGIEADQVLGKTLPNNICTLVVADVSEKIANLLVHDMTSIPTIAVHKIFSYSKNLFWISVTSATATKLHAVVTMAKKLGVQSEEMIGVGDGYNDYPLLSACGLKIAMGNAAPELKEIADFIAPSVDEDGVATVIERFILKR